MTQILILACCVYGSLLVAAVYFTWATTQRVVGALAIVVMRAVSGPARDDELVRRPGASV